MEPRTLVPLLIVGLLVVSSLGMASAATCKNRVTTMTYTSSGYPVYSGSLVYKVSSTWCYSNGEITSFSYTTSGKVNGNIYWTYKGVQSTSRSGGAGSTYAQITAKAKFYNNKKTTTCGDLYPIITQRVYATGGIGVATSDMGDCPGSWRISTV